MKFLLGLTWFLQSYYKFILFVIVKSELYFGGYIEIDVNIKI